MEDIVQHFLEEVNDIEKSTLFMDDNDDEPTTEWVEEIDPRTNFPFYWNSTTKESVWDKPESYDDYLIEYERYLKNVMDLQCIERAREQHEDDVKKRSEMRGLLGYSDSEEECEKDVVIIEEEKEVNTPEEIIIADDTVQEESIASKKERWMSEQVILAKQYLNSLVKSMSETALRKLQLLTKEANNGDKLTPITFHIQTRLEDWEGGYLTIERTVDKLHEALVLISQFEGDLESSNSKLQWDNDTMKYFFVNTVTGKKRLGFSDGKHLYEDGEIVDDEEDLTTDLQEYVISTLHRSLLQDKVEKNNVPVIIESHDNERSLIQENKSVTEDIKPPIDNTGGIEVGSIGNEREEMMENEKGKESVMFEDSNDNVMECTYELEGCLVGGEGTPKEETQEVLSTVATDEKISLNEDMQCHLIEFTEDINVEDVIDGDEKNKCEEMEDSMIIDGEKMVEDSEECTLMEEKLLSLTEEVGGSTTNDKVEHLKEDHNDSLTEGCISTEAFVSLVDYMEEESEDNISDL